MTTWHTSSVLYVIVYQLIPPSLSLLQSDSNLQPNDAVVKFLRGSVPEIQQIQCGKYPTVHWQYNNP